MAHEKTTAYRVDLFVTNHADDTAQRLSGELVLSEVLRPAVAAPRIVTQPVGSIITSGQTATLSVVATGTPPLAYQWYTGETAVPGATTATVEVGPAATTSYFCRVTNAAGSVDSAGATVTVQPNVVPITGLGLTYRRKIALPSLWMNYAYGDMTGRVVDGKVRLIFSGTQSQGSPIYEVQVNDDQPLATLLTQYWSPYHDKRGTWITATAARETAAALQALYARFHDPRVDAQARRWAQLAAKLPKTGYTYYEFGVGAINGTHYYHAGLDLLFVGYGDPYNVAGRPDWTHCALRLHPDASGEGGTTEAFGPWRFELEAAGYLKVGPFAAGTIRESPFDGSIMSSNALGSGNSQYPWGPNCISGAAFPSASSPAGPEVPNGRFTDRWLYGYFMGDGSIDGTTGVANGPIRSARRRRDPYIFHQGQPQTCVNPARYNGVGSWTEVDGLGGLLPLPDRVYFFGSVLGSPSQDPNDCQAAHGWYATDLNVPPFTCEHGCAAVPGGITGPVATAKFPWCSMYPWASLEATKNTDLDYTPEPAVESNLTTDFGIVTASEVMVGSARVNNAGFFNPETRRYYTIAHSADPGETTFGVVNAYIHEWDVA